MILLFMGLGDISSPTFSCIIQLNMGANQEWALELPIG